MPYASEADLAARYGQEQLLLLADRDGSGQADPDVLAQALADADAEIDAHLAARYALPLPSVPTVLTRLACDITVYRLATEAGGGLTEERRKRYEDAVSLLKRLAVGDAGLGFAEPPPPAAGGAAVLVSPPRRFGRGAL